MAAQKQSQTCEAGHHGLEDEAERHAPAGAAHASAPPPQAASRPPLLLIDNYDSFTFNLFQQIARVSGVAPLVVPNNRISLEEIKALELGGIVISPGPGRPEVAADFGVCGQVLTGLELPLLGVCLGHQGLAHFCGGKVVHAPRTMHGRMSQVRHNRRGIFRGVPQGFSVVRYHSLAVAEDLPACLEPTAWTEDGVLMGLRHRTLPFWGIQFHPESVCTAFGDRLIENFVRFAELWRGGMGSRRSSRRASPSRELSGSTPLRSPVAAPQGAPESPAPVAAPQANPGFAGPLGEFVVRHRTLPFWTDPEAVFVGCYQDREEAFWLDSNRAEEGLARFSFLGSADGPHGYSLSYALQDRQVKIKRGGVVSGVPGGIFEFLKRELARCRVQTPGLPFAFNGGFAGYLGYELKAECGGTAVHPSALPDAAFVFADRLLAFDHWERKVHLLALTVSGQEDRAEAWFGEMQQVLESLGPPPPVRTGEESVLGSLRLDRSYETYLSDIRACQREIREGESYEVCLTNQLRMGPLRRRLDLYRILRRVNPAPYSAFLRFGSTAILSSSPERFLQVGADRTVTSKPIKGTRPRQADPALDRAEKEALAGSEKDRAENLMIVDLVRNDLGRVCEVGTVRVPKLMDVESYATVHQLVTTVQGRLREDADAVDCIRAAFPGGSMTGAPKIRTMELIDRFEREARGVYSGAIGYLGLNGSADLNIVIRTLVCGERETSLGIGGAIVDLSDPEDEFQETLLKARALLQALAQAEGGATDPAGIPIAGAPQGLRAGLLGRPTAAPAAAAAPPPLKASAAPAARASAAAQPAGGALPAGAPGGPSAEEIQAFRQEIDLLDRVIVRTLGRRFEVCQRVAGFKKRTRMPMMQPERIQEIKRSCVRWGERYGVRPEFLHNLYDLIIGEACRLEVDLMGAAEGEESRAGARTPFQVAEGRR